MGVRRGIGSCDVEMYSGGRYIEFVYLFKSLATLVLVSLSAEGRCRCEIRASLSLCGFVLND